MHGSHSSNGCNGNNEESTAAHQERLASLNMNSRIYTSADPQRICSTPKTLLMNVLQSMRELMESRMSRMILQLLKNTKGATTSTTSTMLYLLAPGRNAIKVCTVVTRFESADDDEDEEEDGELNMNSNSNEGLVTKMIFKAVLDIKIFGEVTTVEICGPVSFIGKFLNTNTNNNNGGGNDNPTMSISACGKMSNAPLLSSVDIKFNCIALLREMMDKARVIVKKAVTEAASLSVKILSVAGGGGMTEDNTAAASSNSNIAASSVANVSLGGMAQLGIGVGAGNESHLNNGLSKDMLAAAAAFKFGGAQQQQQQGLTTSVHQAANNSTTDYSGMLAAVLKLGTNQGLHNASRQVTNAAGTPNHDRGITDMLASALNNLGGHELSSSQKPSSLPTAKNDNAGVLAAASKLGTLQSQGPAAGAGLNQPPAVSQVAGLAPASSLAQLSSLLQQSTSSNLLGANNNNNATALKSNHSFSSLFGSIGNLGSLRNDTFSSLLKSSNSLNRLVANADWGLHRGGGDSAANILRRHLNASAGTNGSGGGNANATFDFGSANNNNNGADSSCNDQARNLLLSLARGAGGGSSAAAASPNLLNSLAARISNDNIDGMKNVVRFQQDQISNPVAAAAGLTQPQGNSNALKQQMLEKLGNMFQQNPAPQYNLFHDMLLKTNEAPSSATTAPSTSHLPQHATSKSPEETGGNIHKGLFSWLENDSMFLSEDKLKEQDLKHKKKEKENRDAPMPLRFFSSIDDVNGNNNDLERMGQSIFGKKRKGDSFGIDGRKKNRS